MSYEEAKEALRNLYEIFDRGIELQKFGTAKDPKEDIKEQLEDLKIDGYLEEGSFEEKSSYALKLKKIFALIEALGEFSIELFGVPHDENYDNTYMELNRSYLEKKPISDDFLKRPDFLDVFRKKLVFYTS